MRVLHILEATQGGTRRHILDLLPALQARGIACDLACSFQRNPRFVEDAECLQGLGIGIHEVPMARSWGGQNDVTAWRALRACLQSHHYDIIHCHSSKAGFLGRLLQAPTARRPIPLVYTPHCIAFDTGLPRPQRRTARVVEKLLAPRIAHYIAVARHELRMFYAAGLCAPERARVIYNGIDLTVFDELIKAPPHLLHSPPPTFTIGCFGRLTRQKNQAALLRAFAEVKQAVPHARLLFIGGGEDEAGLRALAMRLGVSDSVIWAGEVTEARPYYALCDVVAQPSRWEGCPYSILEAMTARRPVLATAVGGVPELLTGHDGLIYPPWQPQLLAENLISLATNPETRAQLGSAARQCIEQEFQLEQMVERTVAVYESII